MNLRALGYGVQDLPLLGYAALMALLVGLHPSQVPEGREVVARHLLVAFGYLGLIRILSRARASELALTWARVFALHAGILLVFSDLSRFVPFLAGRTLERELLSIDVAMFGTDPQLVLQDWLNPVAVDVFSVCHASCCLLPLIAAIALLVRRDVRSTHALMLGVTLSILATYALYLLVPARSPGLAAGTPGFADAFPYTQAIAGGGVGDWLRQTLDGLEPIRLDAFPSAPTAVALTTLLLLWRPSRLLFWIVLPLVAAIVISTVYLRYQYGIGVPAGAALAVAVAWLAARWRDRTRTEVTPCD